jgi:predicted 3-demethylubiquinone-9 3-methyltransferase (glyoxalase superfamily)
MSKISPFLWFDHQAEEAANFYVSVFKTGRILRTMRTTAAGPGPEGAVMVVEFELDGLKFAALNGGPHFTPNESVSLVIDCKDQAEVDYYWDALLADGGQASACGWLKDRYGFSWQVTPTELIDMINDPDRDKAAKAMTAMMQMIKIDIAKLREAVAS